MNTIGVMKKLCRLADALVTSPMGYIYANRPPLTGPTELVPIIFPPRRMLKAVKLIGVVMKS